jgi:hypothetical protein
MLLIDKLDGILRYDYLSQALHVDYRNEQSPAGSQDQVLHPNAPTSKKSTIHCIMLF